MNALDIFWVKSSGHFLVVITNVANTIGQLTQGVQEQSPCQVQQTPSKHCSVSGQGVRGKAPARISKHCSVSGLGWVRFGFG